MGKGSMLPIYRTQQDGNDADAFFALAFKRLAHLVPVAVVGSEKIGANEQQNKGSLMKMGVNDMLPIGTGSDQTRMPG